MREHLTELQTRALPQLSGAPFLTDGGIETTLIFHEGVDLPFFAAFVLLDDPAGRDRLRAYYARYLQIARETKTSFILESPTWRCSTEWGAKLGYGPDAVSRLNKDAIALMSELRAGSAPTHGVVISGCIGPRGDGYAPERRMTAEEAEAYHRHQIAAFRDSDADMVTAITMTHVGEAVGVARAACAAGLPCAISFTLETDGRLPSGETLGFAIEATDAATAAYPAYYMINCAHPEHFRDALRTDAAWLERIRGVRANASRKSHAELDASDALDDGDPEELGADYRALMQALPNLNVFGGCCGTDHRHLHAIARACVD